MTTPGLALLRCPSCKNGRLAYSDIKDNEVRCNNCAAGFSIRSGVIDLFGKVQSRTIAQMVMEFEPVMRIYESPLWRRNPLLTVTMGISFEQEQQFIRNALELAENCDVLDLACGPGIYTRDLAHRLNSGQLIGLDLSYPMLRYAVKRAREEQLQNLLLVRRNALQLPFDDNHLDAVLCCGAIHLFPDTSAVIDEVHRVLKPGGRFAVSAFRRTDGEFSKFSSKLRKRLFGIGSFTASEFAEMLEKSGFGDVHTHHAALAGLIQSAKK